MRNLRYLFFPAILLVLASMAGAETISGKVVSIADGDTITVLLDETQIKVRFHGIDCPESKQDFGTAAKNFTAEQCFEQVVTVVVTDTDRYGRKVGLVILDDGRVLNHELVAAGLAHWYRDYAPHDDTLKTLEAEAKAAKRGVWSRPDVVLPQDFRQGKGKKGTAPYNPPETRAPVDMTHPTGDSQEVSGTVYITKSGTKYHRKGCRFLKNSSSAIALEKAKSAYQPCGVCNP